MNLIGIMQGRLLPSVDGRIQCFPRNNWKNEFSLAAEVGFDCIEWLYDLHDADINPLATERGIEEIQSLSRQYGIKVLSVCAHCFIEKPLLGVSGSELDRRFETLFWLMRHSKCLGANRIVLPLEDTSKADRSMFEDMVTIVRRALVVAEDIGTELDLETSLPPQMFADLINSFPHPLLKVNYDSGNSAYLGYNIHEEFNKYGHRIGGIHIKDKLYGGKTVPLGSGNADFSALSFYLRELAYSGDIVLEVARGNQGDELNWAKKNYSFVLKYVIGTI